jgi:Ca-activated chloride channel homolog
MAVTLQTRLNRPALPEGVEARLFLLIQLTADQVAATGRSPLNLAAVVDRSGSMAGAKLAHTKQALRFLVDQVDQPDYLSITTFDNEVATLQPAAHIANKDGLKAQIAAICDGGSTNLSGGMIAGYREVRRHRAKERVNRVLLMTDGQANVGVTDPTALVTKVRGLQEQGIQLSTLGVGDDFNEDLLTAMAEAGGGNFYYIQNPDQIPQLFAKELSGLLATAAQGLQIRFEAAHGVTVAGVIGYPPAGDPAAVTVSLPDIYGGEVKSLVLELALSAAFAGERSLGSLSAAYADAVTGADVALTQDITVTVTGDSALLESPDDPEVMKQAYLARSAEALDQAVNAADRHDYAAGGHTLMSAAAPMAALAMETGDADLAARAAELQEQARQLQEQQYDAAARKQMKARSYQSRTGRHQDR